MIGTMFCAVWQIDEMLHHFRKSSVFIQLKGWPSLMPQMGLLSTCIAQSTSGGKPLLMGGKFLWRRQSHQVVTKVPHSALMQEITCSLPFSAIIFQRFSTIVVPVSTRLKNRDGSISLEFFFNNFFIFPKNTETLWRLNDIMQDKLQPSGCWSERLFLLRKAWSQSSPAAFNFIHDSGHFF